jgi:hypothetical protein
MNEEESPAMWKLYTSQNESICVRSTYKRLAALLPPESMFGCVRYIDYARDRFNTNEVLNYIVHKRKSFEHEREIRAVIYDNNIKFERVEAKALIVPIDIGNLVEEIFVSPTSQASLSEVVTGLAEKYGLKAPVRQSQVNDPPAY